jgi:hypothetical protein
MKKIVLSIIASALCGRPIEEPAEGLPYVILIAVSYFLSDWTVKV